MEIFNDTRDAKAYRIVRIGDQTWFAENLAFIPRVNPATSAGGIWVYGYDGTDSAEARSTANYKMYGCLYDLETALTVVPEGWHLPTQEEWTALAKLFGPGADDGNRMKQPDLWKRDSGATNSRGFSALPGGERTPLGTFQNLGSGAAFWSATNFGGNDFWQFYLEDVSPYVRSNPTSKEWGFSVRCIRD
jgi:uncharacterized protein (TIGR02145 family)